MPMLHYPGCKPTRWFISTREARQNSPLTDERILHLWDTHVGEPTAERPLTDADKLAFARAVMYAAGVDSPDGAQR